MAGFDAFISYSHSADGKLAPAVQTGLQRLAKPWNRRRALEVFRDQTGLSVTPHLWGSITAALDTAQWFVLLASPESAGSEWVGKEIEYWLASRPDAAERILPVVTGGVWEWADAGGFTPDSTSVPCALHGVFTDEPLYLDLSWARNAVQLDLHSARFREAIAQLAAPMHGTTKDELVGEDVRQFRLARRVRRGAVVGLAALTVAALIASVVAVQQRSEAQDQRNQARSAQALAEENAAQSRARELAALALNTMPDDPSIATLLAVEANYPNGALEPIDVPEAIAALGITMRAVQGATVRRVGPRITASVSDILRVDDRYIATYDATKGTVDLDGNPVPPDWWDARTGEPVASPVSAAEEARMLLRFGERQTASDVIQMPVIGEHPVTEPLVVDDARNRLLGVDPATGDVVVQPIDGGDVIAQFDVPEGEELIQLEVVSDDDVLGVTAAGKLYRWSVRQGGEPAALFPGRPVRSVGRLGDGNVVVEKGDFLDPVSGRPYPLTDDPTALELIGLGEELEQSLSIGVVADAAPTEPGTFVTSPDGSYLAAIEQDDGFNRPVLVWDLATLRRVATLTVSDPSDLFWAAHDTLAIATSRGFEQYRVRQRGIEMPTPTAALAMSADGHVVAASSAGGEIPPVYVGPIPAEDPDERERAGDEPYDISLDGTVALNPTGATIAYATADGVTVADVASGDTLATFAGPYAAAFAPDGSSLALAGPDGLQLVDPADLTITRTIPLPEDDAVARQIAWSPDGTALLVLVEPFSGGSIIESIDLSTGTTTPDITTPVLGRGAVTMAWSPDGSVVAVGGAGGSVELWRVGDDRQFPDSSIAAFVSGNRDVTGLAFSPDGRRLAVSSLSDTTLWDVTDAAAPRRLQAITDLPMWQFRKVVFTVGVFAGLQAEGAWGHVAFRPDGRSLVIAGPSGFAELPDFDPVRACREASAADLELVASVLGTPSACTRVTSLQG